MTRRLHLKQVEAVNRGFAPGEEERRWAARVLAACSEHPEGAFAVDGKLVDKPIDDRARRISEFEASENRSLRQYSVHAVTAELAGTGLLLGDSHSKGEDDVCRTSGRSQCHGSTG